MNSTFSIKRVTLLLIIIVMSKGQVHSKLIACNTEEIQDDNTLLMLFLKCASLWEFLGSWDQSCTLQKFMGLNMRIMREFGYNP